MMMKFHTPNLSLITFPFLFPNARFYLFFSNDSNQILPDWDFWLELGYDLYFRPHPTSQLNFKEYPPL